MSNVLELSKVLNISAYSQIDIPDISLPYFNGVVLLDAESLFNKQQIYYGDEINLQFWKMLNLKMGSDYEPITIYTLQVGYRYIYIPTDKKFTIYDENGDVVFEQNNVESINDFSIDFAVHKSHQFEIHLMPSAGNRSFYRVAEWRKKRHGAEIKEVYNQGVQNIVMPDRVRPYLPDDLDNPSWDIKHLANLDYFGLFDNNLWNESDGKPYGPDNPWIPSNPGGDIGGLSGEPMSLRYIPIDAQGFRLLNSIDWSKVKAENNFYVEALYRLIASNVGLPAYGTLLDNWSIILPLLSLGLYPLLNDVQLPESIYNNRPLYEPWLIWRIFEFINTGITKDTDEEFPVPVFDLSPMYS